MQTIVPDYRPAFRVDLEQIRIDPLVTIGAQGEVAMTEPQRDSALLTPVPREHLEDGAEVVRAQGKVAYGSRDRETFRQLDALRQGQPVERCSSMRRRITATIRHGSAGTPAMSAISKVSMARIRPG